MNKKNTTSITFSGAALIVTYLIGMLLLNTSPNDKGWYFLIFVLIGMIAISLGLTLIAIIACLAKSNKPYPWALIITNILLVFLLVAQVIFPADAVNGYRNHEDMTSLMYYFYEIIRNLSFLLLLYPLINNKVKREKLFIVTSAVLVILYGASHLYAFSQISKTTDHDYISDYKLSLPLWWPSKFERIAENFRLKITDEMGNPIIASIMTMDLMSYKYNHFNGSSYPKRLLMMTDENGEISIQGEGLFTFTGIPPHLKINGVNYRVITAGENKRGTVLMRTDIPTNYYEHRYANTLVTTDTVNIVCSSINKTCRLNVDGDAIEMEAERESTTNPNIICDSENTTDACKHDNNEEKTSDNNQPLAEVNSVLNKSENNKDLIVNKRSMIVPLSDDRDEDGIPDYAQFKSEAYFAAMIIRVPDAADNPNAFVTFSYSASRPSELIFNKDTQTHELPLGMMRIWTLPASLERAPLTLNKGGHYIHSDEPYKLNLFKMKRNPEGEKRFTLYVERVRFPKTADDSNIAVEMDDGIVAD